MTAFAEGAEGMAGRGQVIGRERHDRDLGLTKEEVELARAGIAQLALDHDRRLDHRGGRHQSHGILLDRLAKRSASGSPNRIATSAEVSITIRRAGPARRSRESRPRSGRWARQRRGPSADRHELVLEGGNVALACSRCSLLRRASTTTRVIGWPVRAASSRASRSASGSRMCRAM